MRADASNYPCIRIVIYTNQPQLAHGASELLSSTAEFDVKCAEPEVYRLLTFVERTQPDLILIDTAPEITLGLLGALRDAVPAARVILWGREFSDELMLQSRDIGVAGFLRSSISNEQFLAGLRKIAAGGEIFENISTARATKINLTPRESQLVVLLAQGLRNKEIGSCLGISEGTVRIYLSKLFVKVGARDRLELAVFALKNTFCGQASWNGRNAVAADHEENKAGPVLRSLLLVEPGSRNTYPALTKAAG